MTTVANFTKGFIESLEPSSKRYYVRDSKTPHLIVGVTPTGRKVFYRYGRIYRRPVRHKIGEFGDITVALARQECARINGDVAKGNDPDAERRERRNEKTVGELWEWYLENHAKPHKKTWERDVANYNSSLKQWASRRLSALSTADIQAKHTQIGSTRGKYAANKMRELLRHMYSKAIGLGWAASNPANPVRKFEVQQRERFLNAGELKAFFDAVANIKRVTTRDFIMMALFTGARRSNVCEMRWEHIDFDNAIWFIPGDEFKTKAPQAVVLIEPAMSILRRRQSESDSPWVFPGQGVTGHLVDPRAAWQKALKESGITNLRLHDLRRTLGSWQANMGSSLHIIGKSLGHKTQQATQIYARLQLDPVRESVSRAVEAIIATSQNNSEKS